MKEPKKISLTV